MPLAQRTAAVSLALSIGIVAVAIVLLIWLWYERRDRDPELSEADAKHFKRQDFRRALVALILLTLAFEIFVGSPMEP
jgi:heme A synthase